MRLDLTHTFHFGRRRWLAGIGNGVLTIISLAAASLLLTDTMPGSPAATQTLVAGWGLLVGAAFFAERTTRQFGYLRFDPEGIHLRCGRHSGDIAWVDLESWRLNDGAVDEPGLASLELQAHGLGRTLEAPGGFLSAADHVVIRKVLTAWAPSKQIPTPIREFPDNPTGHSKL